MEFSTIEDILEFALEKEDASYRLYKSAAKASINLSAKKLFEEMAQQEANHKRFIQQLDREKIERYKSRQAPDLKISEYLVDIPYREDMTYQEILVYSMKSEEKACRLYAEAETMTDDPELKKLFRMLANEEKKHKFYLESLYDDKVLTDM
ncbi:MAG: ferritin [Geobacteraceae bacterium]|nr:ferritin [Geobacteraceae bacterium]